MRTANQGARRLGPSGVCFLLVIAASPTAAADESGFSLGGSFDTALQPYFDPLSETTPSLPAPRSSFVPSLALPPRQATTQNKGAAPDGLAGGFAYHPDDQILDNNQLSLTASGAYIDPTQWSVGLGVGLNGFSIGGSYSAGTSLAASDTLDIGVAYSAGAWSFGLAYQNQENLAAEAQGKEDNTRLEAGFVYSLGPRFHASASAVAAYGSAPESEPEIDDLAGVLGFSFRF